MSLNIKNERTHRLVRELARTTGESMTAAVDKAVQERLERVRKRMPGSPMYRTDIGLKLSKQLPKLQKHGYAKGLIFSGLQSSSTS